MYMQQHLVIKVVKLSIYSAPSSHMYIPGTMSVVMLSLYLCVHVGDISAVER